jgi:hypothetical protein
MRPGSLGWMLLGSTCVCWAMAAGQAVADDPVGTSNDKEILVGANYFAGWWEELPNKWHGLGWSVKEADWRPAHPERDPLLGIYNDQATLDREIAAAADYGIDFFAMLWYFPLPGSKEVANCKWLNRGLEGFLKSPHANRMRFIIEYCNHAQFAAGSDDDWQQCLHTWIAAMRHPSYLRVGGRLVFKVSSAGGFWTQNGGDLQRCRARLDALRQAVRDAGLGEMLLGGGIAGRSQVKPDAWIAQLFDFTATYMSVPAVEVRDEEYPFARLASEAHNARVAHATDPIPWVPSMAAGWNPRPWSRPQSDENHRRFFQFPTRAEWVAELQAMRDDLAQYPGLGLPLPDHRQQKIFTIYAWNEFGEGGILAPTRGEGFMKLEAIREVFHRQ